MRKGVVNVMQGLALCLTLCATPAPICRAAWYLHASVEQFPTQVDLEVFLVEGVNSLWLSCFKEKPIRTLIYLQRSTPKEFRASQAEGLRRAGGSRLEYGTRNWNITDEEDGDISSQDCPGKSSWHSIEVRARGQGR
jgi:hypothetical protein